MTYRWKLASNICVMECWQSNVEIM